MKELVETFMAGVVEVAREAAREQLRAALLGNAKAPTPAPAETRPAPVPAPVPAPASPPSSERRSPAPAVAASGAWPKGAKRPQAALASLSDLLRRAVTEHPGLRVEQLNELLGTTTRDVARPLKKLVAAGVLRTEGEKRSTRYFPAAAAVAAKPQPRPVAPLRRQRAG